MWWSLIRKELREIAPYAIVGAILYLLAVAQTIFSVIPLDNPMMMDLSGCPSYPFSIRYSNTTGLGSIKSCVLSGIAFVKSLILFGNQFSSPFTSGIMYFLYVMSLLYAVAIGLRQTLGEEYHKTYPLLLHLPSRGLTPFVCKILVGIGVYLISTLLMIFVLAWYSAIPGRYPFLFEWSMVWPLISIPIIGVVLYLSIFLTGLRQARWYGTRFLPVVICYLVCNSLLNMSSISFTLLVSLLLILILMAAIVNEVAQRDYR